MILPTALHILLFLYIFKNNLLYFFQQICIIHCCQMFLKKTITIYESI